MSLSHSTPASACAISEAAEALEAGRLVAFPTETVYGLGADAENPAAIAAIYAAKGRPSNHPVIVHIAPEADPGYWLAELPQEAQTLIQRYWPGPLTLILPRAAHIPAAVAGGQNTLGIRCPSHPVAQALLRDFKYGKGGVAAPSANKFGHVSPTLAEHVLEEFAGEIGAGQVIHSVLDGGASEVGIESTILDLSRLQSHGPVLLRPGHISAAELAETLARPVAAPDAQAPRASGTLDAHYAPHTPVVQVAPEQLENLIATLQAKGKRLALLSYQAHPALQLSHWRQLRDEPIAYAHDLYAGLRELDHAHADLILVEALPNSPAWQGINDRLRRAAFDSQGILVSLLG